MTKKGKACENEPEFLIRGNNEEKENKIKESTISHTPIPNPMQRSVYNKQTVQDILVTQRLACAPGQEKK